MRAVLVLDWKPTKVERARFHFSMSWIIANHKHNSDSMEDSMSSTNYKNNASISGDGLELSSGDSSWSLYLDNSVCSSNVEYTVSCLGSESSSLFSDDATSIENSNFNDDHVASARSVAKRRKIRATFVDHELEDTATSPACNSEVQEFEHFHMSMQEMGCGLNMLPSKQQGQQDYGSFFQVKQNVPNHTGEVAHSACIMKDINYAGLKEKGLCLVPLSLLFQVY